LSAWILGGLPVFFFGYLALMRPEYLKPMLTNELGWVMLGTAVVMMIVGAFWLKKTVKVEV
jgi:tight adherence protein B